MNKFVSIGLLCLVVSCSNYGQLTFITKLPKKLDENSGIVALDTSKIWVVEDNGNADKIYQVDFDGKLLREIKVKNAKNRDWEDLAKDSAGNIYIGDFGNNGNARKDLVIYKVPNPAQEPGDKIDAEEIRFRYPEQKKFPPEKDRFFFDAEGFFYGNDNLYVITKNKASPFTGEARVYRIPAQKGEHLAELVGKFITCQDQKICVVTSADISPDGKRIVLLGYGKLWIFSDFTSYDFVKGKMQTIDLGATTQLESICFVNDSTLLLSDEQSHGTGRNLYSFRLNN